MVTIMLWKVLEVTEHTEQAAALACGVCCSLQGVNALQPVLKNATRQTDGYVGIRIAGADGFLEGGAPADGGLWHLYGRAIRQTQSTSSSLSVTVMLSYSCDMLQGFAGREASACNEVPRTRFELTRRDAQDRYGPAFAIEIDEEHAPHNICPRVSDCRH